MYDILAIISVHPQAVKNQNTHMHLSLTNYVSVGWTVAFEGFLPLQTAPSFLDSEECDKQLFGSELQDKKRVGRAHCGKTAKAWDQGVSGYQLP